MKRMKAFRAFLSDKPARYTHTVLDFIKFFNYCCAWLDFGLPESGGNQVLQFYLVLESLNTMDLGVKSLLV